MKTSTYALAAATMLALSPINAQAFDTRALETLVKQEFPFSAVPYTDKYGNTRVCYGTLLPPQDQIRIDTYINNCDVILRADIRNAVNAVLTYTTGDIPTDQFDSLVLMYMHMGHRAFVAEMLRRNDIEANRISTEG